MVQEIDVDFVVVGAGSAGCVIANRLSQSANNSVALVEAGGWDNSPWIHLPVGYFRTMHNPAYDWCFLTQADPGLGDRAIDWPRGKTVGGSSSLNGLLYVRGQPQDYDRWRQMGNQGWGWDDVLPLFKRAENFERGGTELRGVGGGLNVSDMSVRRPICDAWVEAAQAAGYPFNPDYNGPSQEGVGYFQLTTKRGLRCSSAVAFLHPIKRRKNLSIITGAQGLTLQIDRACAKAVEFTDRRGHRRRIRAKKEIILSAGAIGSPHILMTSGVGDADELSEHGIDLHQHLPGVGKNLQDHLQARLVFKCHEPTLNDEVNSWFKQLGIGVQYILTRQGPMTMAASLAVGFMKTSPDLATPDIQFHIQPWSADSPGEGVHPFSAFTMSVCQLRPESRGHLALRSSAPADKPSIHPNYLATERDRQTLVEGIKIARRIATFEPLKSKISSPFRPTDDVQSDDDILTWARRWSTTIYHPTGTCKMGSDPMAVVDERLNVHGIQGLRVADCSIMPEIVSGNTNAPAIMIGEKLSDMVLEDHHLPPAF